MRCRLAVLLLPLLAVQAVAQTPEVAKQAEGVLKTHCFRCHGLDGRAEGGFNYVLDRAKLVERKKVVPGKPDDSKIIKKIQDGSMPPEDDNGVSLEAFPAEARAALVKWIMADALDFNPPVAKRDFITPEAVLVAMRDNLNKLGDFDRQFARYFTLTHLYNAGLPDNQLETYRLALSKLVNSLSWGRKVVPPQAVDAARTIYRIDLRDYKWDEKIWNLIAGRNPYGVTYDTTAAKSTYGMTKTVQPS
jgi:mono/diheme cytochrome c family protein